MNLPYFKSGLLPLLIISGFFCFGLTLSACRHKHTPDMPLFEILLKDSTTVVTSSQIPSGKPIILIFFSPDCSDCQEETKSLLKNITYFKNVLIYFITDDPLDRMKVFNSYYKLTQYPNITVGRDYNFDLTRNFKIKRTPYIFIYDKYKTLRIMSPGSMEVDKIKTEIDNIQSE